MIRLYADEHVASAVTRDLRRRGIDVLSVSEAGMSGASDEEQLAFSRGNQRVLFTQDADFLRLAAAGHVHAGIVYAPQGTPIGRIISGLMLICQVLEAEDMIGKVEFI